MRLLRWLRNPEIIGPPECPIMRRWTLVESPPVDGDDEDFFRHREQSLLSLPLWLTRDRKLMVHHFLPNVEDRDPHDHPRPFTTLVLRGGYFNLVPCPHCGGFGEVMDGSLGGEAVVLPCGFTGCRAGLIVGDVMRPGMVRHRVAEHTHVTQSGPRGAWTIVLMGPFERAWGFWRSGRFWPFKDYEARFGLAMRCPTDEELEGTMLKFTDKQAKALDE